MNILVKIRMITLFKMRKKVICYEVCKFSIGSRYGKGVHSLKCLTRLRGRLVTLELR